MLLTAPFCDELSLVTLKPPVSILLPVALMTGTLSIVRLLQSWHKTALFSTTIMDWLKHDFLDLIDFARNDERG